jgi:hypothetical protein
MKISGQSLLCDLFNKVKNKKAIQSEKFLVNEFKKFWNIQADVRGKIEFLCT